MPDLSMFHAEPLSVNIHDTVTLTCESDAYPVRVTVSYAGGAETVVGTFYAADTSFTHQPKCAGMYGYHFYPPAVTIPFNVTVRADDPPSTLTAADTTVPILLNQTVSMLITWTSQARHTLLCVLFNSQEKTVRENTPNSSGLIQDSFDYPLNQIGTYLFRLYDYDGVAKGDLLANLAIKAVPTGSLQASEQQMIIPIEGTTVTLAWQSNAAKAQVTVSKDGQAEVQVSNALPQCNGSVDYPLKVSGNYIFQLYDYSNDVQGMKLGGPVTVVGQPNGAISAEQPPSVLPLTGADINVTWKSSAVAALPFLSIDGQEEIAVPNAAPQPNGSIGFHLKFSGSYVFTLYDYSDGTKGDFLGDPAVVTSSSSGQIRAASSAVTVPAGGSVDPQVSWESNGQHVDVTVQLQTSGGLSDNLYTQPSDANGDLIQDKLNWVISQPGAYLFTLSEVNGGQLDQCTVNAVEACSPCINSNCAGCLNNVCTGCNHDVCTGCLGNLCGNDYCYHGLSCRPRIQPYIAHNQKVSEMMNALSETGDPLSLEAKLQLPEIKTRWAALSQSEQKTVKMMWQQIHQPGKKQP